jgi:hypothetical protein
VSAVILRTVKHRLSDLIQKPGGVTFAQAMAGSEAELAKKAGPALEVIGAKVVELGRLTEAGGLDAAGIDQAYRIANEIVNITGCLKMPALFAVSYSLCEILDHARSRGFSREAYEVHVGALRLILAGGEGPAIEQMIAGLKAVKARVLGAKAGE